VPSISAHVRRPLAGLAAAIFLAPALAGLTALPAYATGSANFVSLANVKRASVGLGPVSTLAAVDQVAVERGNQMAAANSLTHDLTYVSNRLGQLGVCASGLGEIIAWQSGGPQSYQFTIDQWWASAGHHAIMVGDYNVAGGSWSTASNGAIYSVMIFVKTCASTASANAAPTITARSPASGAAGVNLAPGVNVIFSEAVTGVSASTMVLRDAIFGTVIPSTVSYDSATHRALLRPGSSLALGRAYRVSLSSAIRDLQGAALASTSWTFRTTTCVYFSPSKLLSIAAGLHTGYRFSSTGAIVAHRTYRLSRNSGAPTSRWAVIPNRSGTWYYVTAGIWAGYWLPASSSVKLA
jgi:hypothetical protein